MVRVTVALLCGLMLATTSSRAQDALAINDLSATPRLHEDGRAWTVQVRFTTPIPALARMHFGPDAACALAAEPEGEPLRNHRFDIPDVPVTERRFVRVTANAADQEVTSDVIEVAPPQPFPTGEVERVEVPLTVTETAGVAREEPVTFGIPLPQGALGDPGRIELRADDGSVPAFGRALVRWPDGTIKWLLVESRVRLQPSETKELTLALGTGVRRPVREAPDLLRVEGEMLEATTGFLRLSINRATGEGAIRTEEGPLCPVPVSRLTTTDGRILLGRAERVSIEEDGPGRAVILVEGHHVDEAGEPYFGYALRYFIHPGDRLVRVDHILRHDIVSPQMQYGDEMKSFAALDLVFPIAAGDATVALEEGRTAAISAGERLFQHFDDAYELGERKGTRAPGLVSMGGLTVAVRDFWQNWPKSLAAEEGALVVGLYPRITPPDRYAGRPDEHIHYYHVRDGSYTFRAGLEKRHELLIGPSDAATPEQVLARANQPLVVTADPAWYTSSGALPGISAVGGEQFTFYDEALAKCLANFLAVREASHWYGMMNFGDWWGERGNNWGNIEYDLQNALLLQYFRTGDVNFFRVAEQAARHNADIDVVHYAAGQRAGPGGPRRVGQAWVHCMGHTGGYYPHDYMDMDIYAQGYCENRGHMWNQGNLQYWLLTGDEQVHRSAMQLADWVAGPNITDFSYGNARVPAWMGIIAMSTYFATYDQYYLNAMRMMYREVQLRGDEKAGLWVHELSGGHCNCNPHHHGEAGFMAGVLMTALKYYYEATGDAEVAERIVKIANFCVDSMYEPKEYGFRYTSCPMTGVSSSSTLIMANGLAFAANYSGDERLMQLTRDLFARACVPLGGGDGKSIGYTTCAAPMAIYEISRFPGPTLPEVVAEMLQVAQDPARRPLPCIVPNPDFEEGIDGWRIRGDLTLAHSTQITHSGSGAAVASGPIAGQNEYFVTHYACGAPWEIMSLVPGESYRLQLWLRVDRIGAGIPAPSARVSVRSSGVTRASFTTNEYDLARIGTWQLLRTQFTVPEGTDAAYVAVNTNTRDAQEVLMYLDDVAIVPADAPERDTYLLPAATAEQATAEGGVALMPEGVMDGWEVLGSPQGRAGAATFTVQVPMRDTYRLLLRTKAPDAAGELFVLVDGQEVGSAAAARDRHWAWLAVRSDERPVELELDAGPHTVRVRWPEGSGAMVQKIALSNELAP
ncbi:MAG: hypothetical protein AB7Y46_15575 [Armatimonadota bacterium]